MKNPSSRKAYTVKQINDYVFMLFDNEPFLSNITVRGEVSNLTYHRSGHIYFDMKDSSGKLSAVMYKSARGGLTYHMREGDEIIATGDISVYKIGGTYSIHPRRIERAGRGDLYEQFERLKAKLLEMGMFDESYKQPIPKYSQSVGVVTAPTGAAVRDIIRVSKRRNPYVELIIAPAKVQGEGAAYTVIDGIQRLDALGLDVIIIARGGGSIEDLWEFNNEDLARAIFNCETPIISAVGHQTDYTIADFTADFRAATPSEAAEIAVYDHEELISKIGQNRTLLWNKMSNRLNEYGRRLDFMEEQLKRMHPKGQLQRKRALLDEMEYRLKSSFGTTLNIKKQRLAVLAGRLEEMSPAKRMAQGYSYLSAEDGKAIKSIEDVGESDVIKNYLSDGVIISKIEKKELRTHE